MRKLVGMIFLVIVLFLLGSFFGVQQMNEDLGISQPVPLPLLDKEDSVPKQNLVKNNELVEKRERIEEVGRFNFFSEMGSSVAEGANQAGRAFLSQIMSFVHNVLNGEKSSES
ncbi:hypothetical protein GN156_12770 [bacterium LRH843]|nr:hypothetical protein [bacterium LRH843]